MKLLHAVRRRREGREETRREERMREEREMTRSDEGGLRIEE
jgi:hypothetical protein